MATISVAVDSPPVETDASERPRGMLGFRCEVDAEGKYTHVDNDSTSLPTPAELRAAWNVLSDFREFWSERIVEAVCRSIVATDARGRNGAQPTVGFADVGELLAFVARMNVVVRYISEDLDIVAEATSKDLVEIIENGRALDDGPTFGEDGRRR